jgi:hypothetical protein
MLVLILYSKVLSRIARAAVGTGRSPGGDFGVWGEAPGKSSSSARALSSAHARRGNAGFRKNDRGRRKISPWADGRNVLRDHFVDPLRLVVGDGGVLAIEAGAGEWRSAKAVFFNREANAYADREEPSAAFEEDITAAFAAVAEWTDSRSAALRDLRATGLKVVLLIDLFMNDDQMEIVLPSAMLQALGSANVPVHIISND